MTLFTQVRGIGILGSSYPRSCIARPNTLAIPPPGAPFGPAAAGACNTDVWICTIADTPLTQTNVCSRHNPRRTERSLPTLFGDRDGAKLKAGGRKTRPA